MTNVDFARVIGAWLELHVYSYLPDDTKTKLCVQASDMDAVFHMQAMCHNYKNDFFYRNN